MPDHNQTQSSSASRRILVAGIGNIFLGDDAFGVEVAQNLLTRVLPAEVAVVDFGIRGIDLVYALLDGYDFVILVDAAPRGHRPGTLYVIEPERPEHSTTDPPYPVDVLIETHSLDPARVLRLIATMGGHAKRLLLVGCEPQSLGSDEDMQMGLSPPVRQAVDDAVLLIESLLKGFLQGEPAAAVTLTP